MKQLTRTLRKARRVARTARKVNRLRNGLVSGFGAVTGLILILDLF